MFPILEWIFNKEEYKPHVWTYKTTEVYQLICCEMCGVVQRMDGKNKSCPGRVGIKVRGG